MSDISSDMIKLREKIAARRKFTISNWYKQSFLWLNRGEYVEMCMSPPCHDPSHPLDYREPEEIKKRNRSLIIKTKHEIGDNEWRPTSFELTVGQTSKNKNLYLYSRNKSVELPNREYTSNIRIKIDQINVTSCFYDPRIIKYGLVVSIRYIDNNTKIDMEFNSNNLIDFYQIFPIEGVEKEPILSHLMEIFDGKREVLFPRELILIIIRYLNYDWQPLSQEDTDKTRTNGYWQSLELELKK